MTGAGVTFGYDIEVVRQKCQELSAAAGEVFAHNPPDWLQHRLTCIMGEALALDKILADVQTGGVE